MGSLIVRGGEGYAIDYASGSGLGFFGAGGFGYSVQVGAFQSTTFITDSAGTVQGAQIDNAKYVTPTGIIYGATGTEYLLPYYPQDKATINLSFHNATSVDTQNWEVRCYDGVDIANAPSGIQCRLAHFLHPDITYIAGGSGDSTWVWASGADGILSLPDSPGSSALVAFSGGTQAGTWHDAYIGVSLSPSTVGSKQAQLYVSLEYL